MLLAVALVAGQLPVAYAAAVESQDQSPKTESPPGDAKGKDDDKRGPKDKGEDEDEPDSPFDLDRGWWDSQEDDEGEDDDKPAPGNRGSANAPAAPGGDDDDDEDEPTPGNSGNANAPAALGGDGDDDDKPAPPGDSGSAKAPAAPGGDDDDDEDEPTPGNSGSVNAPAAPGGDDDDDKPAPGNSGSVNAPAALGGDDDDDDKPAPGSSGSVNAPAAPSGDDDDDEGDDPAAGNGGPGVGSLPGLPSNPSQGAGVAQGAGNVTQAAASASDVSRFGGAAPSASVPDAPASALAPTAGTLFSSATAPIQARAGGLAGSNESWFSAAALTRTASPVASVRSVTPSVPTVGLSPVVLSGFNIGLFTATPAGRSADGVFVIGSLVGAAGHWLDHSGFDPLSFAGFDTSLFDEAGE